MKHGRHTSPGWHVQRCERINSQIQRELSQIMHEQIKSPLYVALLKFVSISEVQVSTDYTHAKVYYTALLDPQQRQQAELALQATSGFMRHQLARRLTIHHTPQLHFVYDHSVERGAYLDQLIDSAVLHEKQQEKKFRNSK